MYIRSIIRVGITARRRSEWPDCRRHVWMGVALFASDAHGMPHSRWHSA